MFGLSSVDEAVSKFIDSCVRQSQRIKDEKEQDWEEAWSNYRVEPYYQDNNRDSVKLDHTVPLQLGGSNDKENLRLVLTSEWQNYTPVENFLGEALRDKKINRREAQKLIKRFKAGDITAEEVYKTVGQ